MCNPPGRSPQERSTKADEYAEVIRGGLPSDEGLSVTWEIGNFEFQVKRIVAGIDGKHICVCF